MQMRWKLSSTISSSKHEHPTLMESCGPLRLLSWTPVRCRDKPYKVRRPQPGDGYACQQTGIHQHAEGRCTRTGCAEATSQWPNAAVYPWQSDQSSLSLAMGLTTIPSSAGADEAGAHWFARLALRLPADINPAYGDAIFRVSVMRTLC